MYVVSESLQETVNISLEIKSIAKSNSVSVLETETC